MNKIDKLKKFLQENYPNIQAFDTRNFSGSPMENVYDEDGIKVDYCERYDYIEIFGLTERVFQSLLDENSQFNELKTFEITENEDD